MINSAKPTSGIPLANQPAYSGSGFSLIPQQAQMPSFGTGLLNPLLKGIAPAQSKAAQPSTSYSTDTVIPFFS
jgi:hypothetical protein